MTFEEIIDKNKKMMPTGYEWWPAYVYHYTDIMNAVSILRDGKILSRANAISQHKMYNENASKAVIDITNSSTIAYARFYFRPKTPTQYHNEGYKHPNARRYETGANVPIPIFFMFSSIDFIKTPGVVFSSESQAGNGCKWYSGIEQFSQLPFIDIYGDSAMTNIEYETKTRHAEIGIHGAYDIKNKIKYIMCRSEPERKTLLALLEAESFELLRKYQGIIKVNTINMFYKNGQYVKDTSILLSENKLKFLMNESPYLRQYARRYCSNTKELLVSVSVKLTWYKQGKVIDGQVLAGNINFFSNEITVTGISKVHTADCLRAELLLEKSLMCISDFSVEDMHIM